MNPKQHAKRNTVLRVIAFLLVAALLYGALSRLLAVNDATEQQYIRSFYLEPKNSLDVMILGASETFTDYCAPLAWQHAGFTSYPLAVSAAQGTHVPLHAARGRPAPDPRLSTSWRSTAFCTPQTERDEFSHGRAAQMGRHNPAVAPTSSTGHPHVHPGREALDVLLPAAQIPRRSGSAPDDIRRSLSLQQQARSVGYSYTKPFLSISMFLTETDEIPVRQQSLDNFNEQSLRTFCETAKKLGIQNVLFARFPHRTVIENYDAVFAKLESVVQEYGYDFVNFDTQIDAIGLDPLSDFANAEHLNVFGAEKFTPYLADYLTTHYDLNTAHSDKP